MSRQLLSLLQESRALLYNSNLWRQMPSLWALLPFLLLPPGYAEHDTICSGYPMGQLGSAVSAMSPLSSLCTPSPLAGEVVRGVEKVLILCRCCSTETPLCYQNWFQPKSKTAPCQVLWRKLTTPAQASTPCCMVNLNLYSSNSMSRM